MTSLLELEKPMLAGEMTRKVIAANRRYFDAVAPTYDQDPAQRYGCYHKNSRERYRAFLKANRSLVCRGLVVNLGCGTGNMMAMEETLGLKPIGVDISAQMLRQAKRVSRRLIQADVHRFPFSDGSVSLASCFLLLHHVYDHALFLSEVYRILMPGGVLFSDYDPNFYPSAFAKDHGVVGALWKLRRKISYRVMKVGTEIDLETARLADYYSEIVPGLKGEDLTQALRRCGFVSVQAIAHSDGPSLAQPAHGRLPHKIFEGLIWLLGQRDYGKRAKILAVVAQKPGPCAEVRLS